MHRCGLPNTLHRNRKAKTSRASHNPRIYRKFKFRSCDFRHQPPFVSKHSSNAVPSQVAGPARATRRKTGSKCIALPAAPMRGSTRIFAPPALTGRWVISQARHGGQGSL